MRPGNRSLVNYSLSTVLVVALVLVPNPSPVTAQTQLLDEALQSIRQAEEIAKDESVKEELAIARKGIERALKHLGEGKEGDAFKEMQGVRSFLRQVLAHPRGESKELQRKVTEALNLLNKTIGGAWYYKASTETAWGLHTSTFETPNGEIKVNLPDDTASGDVVSGALNLEPAGKTDEEQSRNRDELNGYVIEIANQDTPTTEKSGKWIIPAADTGALGSLIPVILKRDGGEVARINVPVQSTFAAVDYRLPTIGQAGRPIQIQGRFDGEFATTRVRVAGQEARVLAESPRKVVFETSRDVVGPTEIEVVERDLVVKGEYHSVGISLTASKTDLYKSERTTLMVKVEGLEKVKNEVTIEVQNRTLRVVHIEGGDVQSFVIRRKDIQPGGIYIRRLTVTGVERGRFTVGAAVRSPVYSPVLAIQEKQDNEIPWWVHVGTHLVSKTLGTALLLLELKGDTMPPKSSEPPKTPEKVKEMCCYEVECCCDQDLKLPNLTDENLKGKMTLEELFKPECSKEMFKQQITVPCDDESPYVFAQVDQCKKVYDFMIRRGDPYPKDYNPAGWAQCKKGKLVKKGECEKK